MLTWETTRSWSAGCEYQEFQPSLSKPTMDEIDQVLAGKPGEIWGKSGDVTRVLMASRAAARLMTLWPDRVVGRSESAFQRPLEVVISSWLSVT